MIGGVDDCRGELLRLSQSKRRQARMHGHAYSGQSIGLRTELDQEEEEDDAAGIHWTPDSGERDLLIWKGVLQARMALPLSNQHNLHNVVVVFDLPRKISRRKYSLSATGVANEVCEKIP